VVHLFACAGGSIAAVTGSRVHFVTPDYMLRFVSDNVWGLADRQFVSMHIARYLVQAWDVRNTCKHSGAVLPLPSAPVGRGVDGIDAMA
jgi:hypothetical protein